ncbi:hypothetical protein OU994_26610 [Pseudoduganella sp. SL102]|uniref:hypothetical protein n=1 Tax=Pseudoduganella sp. SL102 TaxID=2995154 RepID=UPI00248B6DE0|nr:hypothetical protein [Pseudoduganella sp. SL102]WBS01799.1 hypothetical protein OU994_26610 [Pseudoduganella sp. SL102]
MPPMTSGVDGPALAHSALAHCLPRLRSDALLGRALEAFAKGNHADALVAAEYVCRRMPGKSIPAILRAKVLQTAYPFMAARAWHAAWKADACNPMLQDAMLQSWLQDGGQADIASLGPAFLPARCRTGRHASLLALLRKAGVAHTGACWREGDAIEGMVFFSVPAGAPRRVPPCCCRMKPGSSSSTCPPMAAASGWPAPRPALSGP